MPNNGHAQLTVAPELTIEEVRVMGYRAIAECFEAQAKSHDLIAKSHYLLRMVDELLARDRLPQWSITRKSLGGARLQRCSPRMRRRGSRRNSKAAGGSTATALPSSPSVP
jgi:hypothetical protein